MLLINNKNNNKLNLYFMSKNFFEQLFEKNNLNSDVLNALDDILKNTQTFFHTVKEEWENGELVSKDEEKYENGKKTVDIHQTVGTEKNKDNCVTNHYDKHVCHNCEKQYKERKEDKETYIDRINGLTKQITIAEDAYSALKEEYNASQERYRELLEQYNTLEKKLIVINDILADRDHKENLQ